jgi:hypothetical protein
MERALKKIKIKTLPTRDLILRKVFYPIPKDVIMACIMPKLDAISYYLLMMALAFDEKNMLRYDTEFINCCAHAGYLNLVIWLHTVHECKMTERTSFYGVWSGNLELVTWLYNNNSPFSENILGWAKDFSVVKYLMNLGFIKISMDTARKLGERCDSETLGWILMSRHVLNSQIMINAAARTGNLKFLQWCHEHNISWKGLYTMDEIARSGNIELLDWAINNGCGFNRNFRNIVTRKGHKEMLEWAIAHGYPF